VKILVSDSAFSDLEGIKEFYLEQGVPQIGKDQISAIIEHIQTLAHHPRIGRAVPEFDDETIREIIHPPYRIVYLLEEHVTQIIRVWRSERLLKLSENET